jgi:hypothetical protein
VPELPPGGQLDAGPGAHLRAPAVAAGEAPKLPPVAHLLSNAALPCLGATKWHPHDDRVCKGRAGLTLPQEGDRALCVRSNQPSDGMQVHANHGTPAELLSLKAC